MDNCSIVIALYELSMQKLIMQLSL